MSLWHSVRGEMAGAWRSVCYDLGRQPAVGTDTRPDVTCTGMNTFPGSLVGMPGSLAEIPVNPPETGARPPRRFVAIAAFCALAVCGAAGSYLVATTTLADRMTDPPAIAAAPLPSPSTDVTEVPETDAGMGAVPTTARRARTAAITPQAPAPTASAAPRITAPQAPVTTRTSEKTVRPGAGTVDGAPPRPGEPDCDCEMPPVPTPTAPAPVASISPSPSATVSDPSTPDSSPSAVPGVSDGSPSTNGERRHRRHHPR